MNFKFSCISTLLLLFNGLGLGAQSAAVRRNSWYFEAFGQGLYYSFTFDRLYTPAPDFNTALGAGFTLIGHPELQVIATPVSYNYLTGHNKHHLELGVGITPMYLRDSRIQATESYVQSNGVRVTRDYIGHSNNLFLYMSPKIGYRLQKPEGGFLFRLTLTPAVAVINWLGPLKDESRHKTDFEAQTQIFSNAAFFPYPVMPWGGISIGWTFKK